MALFTVILEISGGTYIKQLSSDTAETALHRYAAYLNRDAAIPSAKLLAKVLKKGQPIAIEGNRNVWCTTTTIRGKFVLLNIIKTYAS